jgi:hypothetical protein
MATTSADRLVDCLIDWGAPPQVTFAQGKHLVEALARGTPDAGKIACNIARDTIRELA